MKKANILIIGGGMITQEVILPTIFQERRKGKIDQIFVATRRKSTIEKLRKIFPEEEFKGFPEKAKDPEEPFPECYKEALSQLPKPGIVIVATPDHLHTQMTIDSLKSGFHVIVEKPLCLKVEEVYEIDKVAKQVGGYVYTDYHKRHDPALRACQYKYRKGEMGEVLCGHAWIEERREMPLKWFSRWCDKSSSFEYIGVHYVDMFYFITGLKPVRVIGFGQKKFLPKYGKDAFDAIEGIITWENGATYYVQTSWILPEGNPNLTNQGFQITCTEGEFRADNADRNSNFVTTKYGFERFNPHFFKPFIDWDNPERVEWRGYGADSIIQGIDDCLKIFEATEGLPEEEAKKIRKEMISKFEKTRPLPSQALIGTAVIEGVKLSVLNGSKPVIFDEKLYPKIE
ncbi:MAG: hypothetical protein DRP67_02465 [Candidatus Omnitrophota bacterium]|nr:MAG: hypothetical protein DRP67_02465 [Candidatus Omnitrophota bacterium]